MRALVQRKNTSSSDVVTPDCSVLVTAGQGGRLESIQIELRRVLGVIRAPSSLVLDYFFLDSWRFWMALSAFSALAATAWSASVM